MEPGEIIPCDGIFISGHGVLCDESALNGESDAIKKVTFDECINLRDQWKSTLPADGADAPVGELGSQGSGPIGMEGVEHTDCFIVSGGKVLEGVGRYVVVAVGQKSYHGRILMGKRPPSSPDFDCLADFICRVQVFVEIRRTPPCSSSSMRWRN